MSWGVTVLHVWPIFDLIAVIKYLHGTLVCRFVVEEVAMGLGFLPVVRFSHNFHTFNLWNNRRCINIAVHI